MALEPITIKVPPGVDTQSTPFQTGAGLQASNAIRHKNGFIEKMGGCTRMSSGTFTGTAVAIHPWNDLVGNSYLAIGTTLKLQMLNGTTISDISPAGFTAATEWSMDHYGQNLVCNYPGSTLYQWVPPIAGGNIATPVTGAPSAMYGCLVAAPEQQVIAFGSYSSTLGQLDPLLVAWCDISNLNAWTATATNQAGTFRLTSGSKIVNAVWFGLTGLVWTDLSLWSMTYSNFPLVYGFNEVSRNCGLISRRAVAQLGTSILWLSQNDFFLYQGGQVAPIECKVRDFIFDNLDRAYLSSIHADANTYFGTITVRFPMTGSGGVCNGWVSINLHERLWDYGEGDPQVSAWTDQSVLGAPIGTLYTGLVEQFETSNGFDGLTVNSGFTSGWISLAKGQEFIFVERVLPDQTLSTGGTITLQFDFADYLPADQAMYPIRSYGPYTVTEQTPFIIIEGRGRFVRVTLSCTDANTFWRMGEPIAIACPDGSL